MAGITRKKFVIASWILTFVVLAVCWEEEKRTEVCALLISGEEGHSPPANLTANPISGTELNVTWTSPPVPPDFYRLTMDSPIVNVDIYDTYYVLSYLQPCTEYVIFVASVYDGDDECKAGTQGETYALPPPPPKNCNITSQTSSSMDLSWSKPVSPCRITHYGIFWSYQVLWSDGTGRGEANATGTRYYIRDLIPYTNYSYSIKAATEAGYGEGLKCFEATKEDVPGPVDVREVIQGNRSATIKWGIPGQANGIIQAYKSALAFAGGVLERIRPRDPLWVEYRGLDPCENYTASVKAGTLVGWGDSGLTPSFVLINDVAPAEVQCRAESESTIYISWEPNSVDCPVSQYVISWTGRVLWENDTDFGSVSIQGSNTILFKRIRELRPYTYYRVCVDVGQSVLGPCDYCVTEEGAPSAPYLQELKIRGTKITASWEEPKEKNGLISSYLLIWTSSQGAVLSITTDGSTHTHTIPNLTRCLTYTITVQGGTDGGGLGDKSNVRKANITNSVSEEGVQCSGDSSRSSQLWWGLSSMECPVSSYTLAWTSSALWNNESASGQVLIPGTELSYTLTDLQPYSEFNSCLSIEYSQESPVCCTNTTAQEASSPPTSLTVLQTTQTSISFKWSIPERLNGRLTGWLVDCTGGEGAQLGEEIRNHTCSGLHPGTNYSISVRAVNGVGPGEAAEEMGVTKPGGEGQPTTLIIGTSVVAGVLLLLLLLLAVYYTRRKRYRKTARASHIPGDKYRPTSEDNEAMDEKEDSEHDSYSHDMYKAQQKSYRAQRYWSEKMHGKLDFDVALWAEDVTERKTMNSLDLSEEEEEEGERKGSRKYIGERGSEYIRNSHYYINGLPLRKSNIRNYSLGYGSEVRDGHNYQRERNNLPRSQSIQPDLILNPRELQKELRRSSQLHEAESSPRRQPLQPSSHHLRRSSQQPHIDRRGSELSPRHRYSHEIHSSLVESRDPHDGVRSAGVHDGYRRPSEQQQQLRNDNRVSSGVHDGFRRHSEQLRNDTSLNSSYW